MNENALKERKIDDSLEHMYVYVNKVGDSSRLTGPLSPNRPMHRPMAVCNKVFFLAKFLPEILASNLRSSVTPYTQTLTQSRNPCGIATL